MSGTHVDPNALPSWRDGSVRATILEYVARVTTPGGADEIPPAERVAVFDNDGTLWCERPAYLQALFILDRLRELAAADPQLGRRDVVAALLAGDLEAAMADGGREAIGVLLETHAGLTTEEFAAATVRWLDDYRHPRFDGAVAELIYAPMVELVELLRTHDFRVFIVTGGGVDFVRAISEQIYGITPDDVVGSAVEVELVRRDGRVEVVRAARLDGSPNEGEPKVTNIHAHIGQRPVVAAGNSAGDREMLEYTAAGSRPSLCLAVDHDDDEREYAYAGAAVTNPTAAPLAETAAEQGWTIISMRNDWRRVFPGEEPLE